MARKRRGSKETRGSSQKKDAHEGDDQSSASAELLNKSIGKLDLNQNNQSMSPAAVLRKATDRLDGDGGNDISNAGMTRVCGGRRFEQKGEKVASSGSRAGDGARNSIIPMNGYHSHPIHNQAYAPQYQQVQQQQQQQFLYPMVNPSPYWPYDAQALLNNGFNYFMHPMPQAAYWPYPQSQQFQSPLPQPTSSGTYHLDTSNPPSKDPTPEVTSLAHIPEPTQDYILTTSLSPYHLENPSTKLLILDLNGTLLYRRRHPEKDRNKDMRQSSQKPLLRPHLSEFINYIFRHFKIMFWSSATPRNVRAMISAATTDSQRSQIIAIWDRDSLGLSSSAYKNKSITFKDLTKVFNDRALAKHNKGGWDVSNTILLDDSVIKASHQPYNHVCVPEFMVEREHWEKQAEGVGGWKDDALWQVAGYLDELRYQGHVARFIKKSPFRLGDGWNGMCLGLS